ncbi:MAG: 5'/3'-nucleotidase SurE [Lachnospiraceae bacterium]|uniref:5'-nucleotidase n=1 Tax=Candidatus Weimeria bifida TaxID=2599074 RepID=A0A6N7IX64_9FIRM|nr:5'/3'-nucleotidase SurE [Candidatus Weimeria bifida]RRF97202.1 MAG: 5'/3'-nucleotidase SurE [Lachnospiraceae bacterium]
MRKILITNDDGIKSGGIIRLAQAALEFGDVWVVAPEGERSSMSHRVTLNRDFYVWPADFPVKTDDESHKIHAFACSGTPADCARIGILNIVPEKPDVVFSGINFGYNAATDTQYSATIGAALEAAFQGITAIAFSEGADFANRANSIHEVTDRYLRDIIAELIDKRLPANQIWNVNFPMCHLNECRGILRDRTVSSDVLFEDRYTMKPDTTGRYVCHVNGTRRNTAAEGTDLKALFDNYVSIGTVTNIS